MSLSSNKIRQQVILSKDVKAKIQAIAQKESRSMSNMIEVILKKFIEEQENKED